MAIDYFQKRVLFAATIFLAVGVACSPRGSGASHSALESAIALYIGGQYEDAARALGTLTGSLRSEEDVLSAYLYLGRSYEALGDYVAAAEAFSNGRALGGGPVFEEYLMTVQGHLRSAPRAVRSQPAVTRAQLAALMVRLGGIADDGAAGSPAASDLRGHWAAGYATTVVDHGIMQVMPDGRFHPDEVVTLASFYLVLLRASGSLGASRAVVEQRFPGGYEAILEKGELLVGGAEATDVLQAVLAHADGRE